jgi:sulfate permease, SulP family
VLIVAGWDVAATWYKRLVACPRQDLAVGLLVMAVTLLMGTAPAILVGIVGAMFLYVRNTSRAPLRGCYDGALRQSARIRPEEQAAYLRSLGPAIRIVDVQGALFFGTADRFGREVEKIADGCRHLILDMRRVDEVDPTGALVLVQTMRRLRERGIRTAIAAVSMADRRGTAMIRAGLHEVVPPERWFEDADRALEHAEDIELRQRWPEQHPGAELPLSAMEICSGMSAPQIAALHGHLRRLTLPAGSALFREGDTGDRLYLLARGQITVSIKVRGEVLRNHRLGTYCPGAVLGEMAVLERKPRSADAYVVSDSVVYMLDGAALERMQLENPALHSQFMLNLTRQLIERLRSRTVELRAAYS